jgi:hypothetical protein
VRFPRTRRPVLAAALRESADRASAELAGLQDRHSTTKA